MLGLRSNRNHHKKEDGEKPFWISFSDLMTALMVLFLVSMAVALMAVTQEKAIREKGELERQGTIDTCMLDIKRLKHTPDFSGIEVRGYSIDFGTLAEFENDKDTLQSHKEQFIRRLVPRVLELARRPACEKWLKRVVVEGFASQIGTYLHNLDLSFRRSQRVLCVLLDPRASNALVKDDRKLIRTLFLAGGSSFNTEVKSEAQMRRVELKLEFRELGSQREPAREIPWDEDAACPNDFRR